MAEYFKKYIENGKLLLLNYVISDTNDVDTDFYIGPNTIWSSTQSFYFFKNVLQGY